LRSALDQTIVGTAMPRVIADLHGFEQYAWVVTAYLVASTAVVPIVGKLSDLYGRKLFLLVGVALFIAASALCGAAQTMTQLVAFRVLFFYFPNLRARRETRPRIDYLGALTLLLAVVPLLVALSWGGSQYPWGSPTIVGMLAVAAVMTAAFLWIERRAAEPNIP